MRHALFLAIFTSYLPTRARGRTLLREVLEAAGLRRLARDFTAFGVASAAPFGSPLDAALDLLELNATDLATIGLRDPAEVQRFAAARTGEFKRRFGESTHLGLRTRWVADERRLFTNASALSLSPFKALLRQARLGFMQVGWPLSRIGVTSLRDMHELPSDEQLKSLAGIATLHARRLRAAFASLASSERPPPRLSELLVPAPFSPGPSPTTSPRTLASALTLTLDGSQPATVALTNDSLYALIPQWLIQGGLRMRTDIADCAPVHG